MRLFRSRLLLRSVATLLVVGVSATLAPRAVAQDARADVLRALLNDAEAFEAGLDAAREAADPASAREAFVEAYVEATEGGVTAETVRQLIDGEAMGLVAPVLPDDAFVPTPTPAPTLQSGAAILTSGARLNTPAASVAVSTEVSADPLDLGVSSAQPRGP